MLFFAVVNVTVVVAYESSVNSICFCCCWWCWVCSFIVIVDVIFCCCCHCYSQCFTTLPNPQLQIDFLKNDNLMINSLFLPTLLYVPDISVNISDTYM